MSTAPKRKDPAAQKRTKETHPKLAQRLPRETGCLIIPICHEGMTVLERAMEVLGDRAKETRQGFLLDGKPCNTKDLLSAANLGFADGSR